VPFCKRWPGPRCWGDRDDGQIGPGDCLVLLGRGNGLRQRPRQVHLGWRTRVIRPADLQRWAEGKMNLGMIDVRRRVVLVVRRFPRSTGTGRQGAPAELHRPPPTGDRGSTLMRPIYRPDIRAQGIERATGGPLSGGDDAGGNWSTMAGGR